MQTKVATQDLAVNRWIWTLFLLTLGLLACSTLSTANATSLEIVEVHAPVEPASARDGIEMFHESAPALDANGPFALPTPLRLDLVERVNQMFLRIFEADVYSNENISPAKNIKDPILTYSNRTVYAQIEKVAANKRLLAVAAPGNPEMSIGDNPDYLQYKNIMYRTDI
jgi:hypothetical protein